MASTLLDTIRNNLATQASTQAPVEDQTAKAGRLLRAKSGKAVGPAEAAQPNLGELAAVDQTQQQLQQVGQQAGLASQAIKQEAAGTAQEQQIRERDIQQARKFNTIENKLKTDQILRDYEQNRGRVNLAADKAAAEQLGFNIRLQNQQYVDQLQREGKRSRLDDAAAFQEALARDIYGMDADLLKRQLGNKNILEVSDDEFKRLQGRRSADEAIASAKQGLKDQKEAQKGIVGVVVGGAQNAGKKLGIG